MKQGSREQEQARILADALLALPDDFVPPARKVYASQHDTYLDKDTRSERSLRHLLIAMLKQRDGDKCYLCQRQLEPDRTCIEHIIPLCYGGTNEPWNVALACAACNAEKGNRYVSQEAASGAPCYHLHRATGG